MSKKDFRVVVLYSGSGGNSVLVRAGKTAVLIDAGKSARALCKALDRVGESIDDIDAIFVTHEHKDHVSALEQISKNKNIPIHITSVSAQIFDRCPDAQISSNLQRHDVRFEVEVGDLRVTSFRTPHDSKMSVGYRLSFLEGDKAFRLGLATDIGYVSEEIRENLLGCDAVIIEANHDVDMLMTGRYPIPLKQRVVSKWGHLSNADCAEFAAELAQNGTRAFMLAHLSKENNEPQLAYNEVKRALSGTEATVLVACPDDPVEFVMEEDAYAEREIYNSWNA